MDFSNLLVGSDPEAMIIDTTTGKMISAVGLIPGTKENPESIGNGCYIQADNVNVEWCVPPTQDPEDFIKNIRYCVQYTNSILPQGHRVLLRSSHVFDSDQLTTPEALEFGCDADFCVYNDDLYKPNEKPAAADPNLRSCGGHIHLGHPYLSNPQKGAGFIRNIIEPTLGVALVVLDMDTRRKELYGKAGAVRYKPYGIEYRTPSNLWLSSEELVRLTFKIIYDFAPTFSSANSPFKILYRDLGPEKATSQYIRSIINENKLEQAKEIMTVLGIEVPVLTTK